jgi:hypothetical protein
MWADYGKFILKRLEIFIILEKFFITPLLEVNQFWLSIEASYGLPPLREFRFLSAWFPTPLCRALVSGMVRESERSENFKNLKNMQSSELKSGDINIDGAVFLQRRLSQSSRRLM